MELEKHLKGQTKKIFCFFWEACMKGGRLVDLVLDHLVKNVWAAHRQVS